MSGWKSWAIGEVVEAADFQSYVQDQVIQVYADSDARGSALGTAVAEGMVSYLEDTNKVEVYDGSSWVQVGQEGDITSVTAGTGLTGGGTAGDVTVSADYAAIGSAISITTSQVTDLTASAAALNTIDDGTEGYTALSNGTAGITYQPVSHNYIINGAFDVWQRGTSVGDGSTVLNEEFLADRWLCDDGIGGNFILSQQSFAVGQTDVPNNPTYFHRVDFPTSAGTANQRIEQRIENVSTLASTAATLSFWVKGTMGGSFTPNLVQSFGSGGSSQVTTSGDTFTLSGTWTKIVRTFSVPSISGKTVGAGNYLAVNIAFPNSQLGQIDIANVQLEAGSVATPFKRHAPSLQGELAACQRYYQKVGIASAYPLGLGFATTTSNARVTIPLACNMRATPSVEDDSATIRHQGTNYAISSFASVVLGNGAMVTLNATTTVSSMTANQLAVISANANFALTSEL